MSTTTLPQAPGASTAKTTGILSIILGFLCFPIGLVLAIVALVQHQKAQRAFAANPGSFLPVGNTGLVTAIVGLIMPVVLALIGIVAAIAIPALLGQRSRARDKACISTLTTTTADLLGEYDRLVANRTPREAIPSALEGRLKVLGTTEKNPWDPRAAAFADTIQVTDSADGELLAVQVQALAQAKGTVVFLLSLPDPERTRSGYLAGAVRIQTPVDGSPVLFKIVQLD